MDKSDAHVFSEIFRQNKWNNDESVSGSGSTISATRFLVEQINILFHQLDIRSVLDIPCGDFNWMRHANLRDVEYTGADIVPELIDKNREEFPNERFEVLDIVHDRLPTVDLIICRDCFVHLPIETINKALANIRRSRSRFFLTTTFCWKGIPNIDIATGQWRKINLELAPFNLPKPTELIVEGTFQDKSMGLWSVYQLPAGC